MDDPKPAGTGIKILEWHPVGGTSTLRGFCNVAVEGWRMTIFDCTAHVRPEGTRWVGLPGRPQIGPDGRQLVDEGSGKKKYTPSLLITDRAVSDRFNHAVLAALDQAHPGWDAPR